MSAASAHHAALQRDLARGDARDVEQVVHQPREVLHLAAHHLARPLAHRAVVGHAQDLDRVADRRQGIPQLVREHGEELVLATVGVAQLLEGRRAVALGAAHAQERLHVRHQLLGLDRVDQVAVGAGLEGGHAVCGIGVRGGGLQHHDLRRLRVRLDLDAERAAVGVGQLHVEEHQVRRALGDEPAHRGARGRLHHLEARPDEDAALHVPVGVVVVDVEDQLALALIAAPPRRDRLDRAGQRLDRQVLLLQDGARVAREALAQHGVDLVRGDDDHRDGGGGGIGLQAIEDLVAVHARHREVEEDHLRAQARGGGEAAGAVVRLLEFHRRAQRAAQHVARGLVVVDDERHAGRWAAPSRAPARPGAARDRPAWRGRRRRPARSPCGRRPTSLATITGIAASEALESASQRHVWCSSPGSRMSSTTALGRLICSSSRAAARVATRHGPELACRCRYFS